MKSASDDMAGRKVMHSRRAVLVAPASDERKARKALASPADEVVLDLEDAVVPDRKGRARDLAVALAREFGAERAVSIRINALSTPWAAEDLAACDSVGPRLQSVVLPKTETAEDVLTVAATLGTGTTGIQAILETPRGLTAALDICTASPRLEAVIIGYADLAASLGRRGSIDARSWSVVQELVLLAARSAEVSVIDGPHLTIADDDEFRTAKAATRDLGFDGTWVIHPAQIEGALTIYTPTPEEIADARRVLRTLREASASTGAGAAELDGRMLDEALAASARRILSKVIT